MQFDKMKEYVRKGQMSRRDFVRLAALGRAFLLLLDFFLLVAALARVFDFFLPPALARAADFFLLPFFAIGSSLVSGR